ncbi:MAG TPA: SufD family Fe-S cluster assembly protein [Acidimicrobiales bacterium]|nr:SufD family Fe-S cluster assembly protein [Acidimicrobiales bacterium]
MNLSDRRFSAESLEALGGSEWVARYRASALARLSEVHEATSTAEDWRYGRIDELDLSSYGVVLPRIHEAIPISSASRAFLDDFGDHGALVHVIDGVLVSVELRDEIKHSGITIGSIADFDLPIEEFGSLLSLVDEPFGVLNDAFAPAATVIDVPANSAFEPPIVVISELSEAAVEGLSYARLFIRLGVFAQASVVVFQTSLDGRLLHVPVVETFVGESAHLRLDLVQQLAERSWLLGYQLAEIGRDATLSAFSASLGADYSRLYSRAALAGEGGESRLFAAYLGIATQVQEFRTFQDHLVGRTKSELIFKGAVADHARSVYSGMIHMRKGARRADASQTNRNLVLSEGAHADSVPNLDIDENDVHCSHASAVGPIDPDQLFYLESRGIPPEVAERLILLGFFDDLLSRANNAGCATYIRKDVELRLADSIYAQLAS